MKGKTVVITGATSGIGEAAAGKLAERGARIVLVARDKSRGEETLACLRKRAPGLAHTVHYADLTRILEMKRAAAEIAAAEPRIDVLINNAGALFSARKLTGDGLEYTFALNHMAYFAVTQGLLPRLMASAPARIVSTAPILGQRRRCCISRQNKSALTKARSAFISMTHAEANKTTVTSPSLME